MCSFLHQLNLTTLRLLFNLYTPKLVPYCFLILVAVLRIVLQDISGPAALISPTAKELNHSLTDPYAALSLISQSI